MAEHSDSTHDSAIYSISEIDAALEGPIPPSLIAKLTPFERRLLDHSDIFKKLLHLKRLYSKNPDVEARFERNRASFTGDGGLTGCYHRVRFEEVFAEINEKHNGIFGNGRVKYFLDLGCSPGGFSNWILGANMNAHGIGITLPDPEAPFALAVDDSHLVDESRYHVRGVDLNSIVREAMDQGRDPVVPLDSADSNDARSYDLVIAGAFPTRQADKLWWERLALVFSQLSIALSNLSPGGNLVFIIKTKPYRWLTEVIRLLRLSFATLSAQKGQKLHAIRSSCYLICQDFIATQADTFAYNQSLHNALTKMTGGTVSSEHLHLFPEISDEELFMEEQEFVLPILEAAWMHQYNAMHFDLGRLSNKEPSPEPVYLLPPPSPTAWRRKLPSEKPFQEGETTCNNNSTSTHYSPTHDTVTQLSPDTHTDKWRQTGRPYRSPQPALSGCRRGKYYSFASTGIADSRESWRK